MLREPRYIDASRIDPNQQTLYDYEAGKWCKVSEIPEGIVRCEYCVHKPIAYERYYSFKSTMEVEAPIKSDGSPDVACPFLHLNILPKDNFFCGFGEKE